MIDRNQKRFLAALSAMMAKIVIADGVVVSEEIVSVRLIWSRLGLTAEQSAYCQKSFDIAIKDSVTLERYVQEYVATQYGDSTRALLYELLWELACSDGVLHRLEAAALKKLESALLLRRGAYHIYYSKFVASRKGVVDEEKEELKRQEEAERREREERQRKAREEAKRRADEAERRKREHERQEREKERRRAKEKSPLEWAYATLGCSPLDSDAKLRRGYRILAMKNHPDLLQKDGVADEIIARATMRMAEINEAWNILNKFRKH